MVTVHYFFLRKNLPKVYLYSIRNTREMIHVFSNRFILPRVPVSHLSHPSGPSHKSDALLLPAEVRKILYLSLSSVNVEIILSVTMNAHIKYSLTDTHTYTQNIHTHNFLFTDVMVEIEPSEELVFSNCNIGATATIVLTNPTNTPLAFKVSYILIGRYTLRSTPHGHMTMHYFTSIVRH